MTDSEKVASIRRCARLDLPENPQEFIRAVQAILAGEER